MTDAREMSIGKFAKVVGLTASALRFYDDAGLLPPTRVDPASGYRFYDDSQVERATRIRQLRGIDMSLTAITRYFAATESEAARLLDEHVAAATAQAIAVQRAAADLRSSWAEPETTDLCSIAGPVLAAAIDQVVVTTVNDPAFPVLGGVHLELANTALTLSATDRFRLATRTLVVDHPGAKTWAATIDGADLQRAASRLRRSATVTLRADSRSLFVDVADGPARYLY